MTCEARRSWSCRVSSIPLKLRFLRESQKSRPWALDISWRHCQGCRVVRLTRVNMRVQEQRYLSAAFRLHLRHLIFQMALPVHPTCAEAIRARVADAAATGVGLSQRERLSGAALRAAFGACGQVHLTLWALRPAPVPWRRQMWRPKARQVSLSARCKLLIAYAALGGAYGQLEGSETVKTLLFIGPAGQDLPLYGFGQEHGQKAVDESQAPVLQKRVDSRLPW